MLPPIHRGAICLRTHPRLACRCASDVLKRTAPNQDFGTQEACGVHLWRCSPKVSRSHRTTATLTWRAATPAEGGRTTTLASQSADPARNGRNRERGHQWSAAATGTPLRPRSATETTAPVPQRTRAAADNVRPMAAAGLESGMAAKNPPDCLAPDPSPPTCRSIEVAAAFRVRNIYRRTLLPVPVPRPSLIHAKSSAGAF